MSKHKGLQKLFHHWHYFNLRLLSLVSTPYCRILFKLKGVNLKTGSKFFGVPITYLFPGSTIVIGNNVDVRTSPISNFIGINRKTVIATHGAGAQIIIGNNCGFSGVVIGSKESIIIGNNVLVGANVLITDFDWHSLDPVARNNGKSSKSKPIVIHDNVFIGYSSTILKGVTIGENVVIGANSVVTSNIPANVIAAGNPCKVVSVLKYDK